MQKSILRSAIVLLFLVGISACQKSNNTTSPSILNTAVQKGKWKITLYNHNGKDETSQFTAYDFSFNPDGKLIATNALLSTQGSWSSGNDDSQLKLYLNFGTSDYLHELNNDWHVTLQNASNIKLENVSGGNGGSELLTFEKK